MSRQRRNYFVNMITSTSDHRDCWPQFLLDFTVYFHFYFADCGNKIRHGSRIVGGSNAKDGEWPWQVSLHFSGSPYCGASVITKEWLLSAGHCFQGEKYAMKLLD